MMSTHLIEKYLTTLILTVFTSVCTAQESKVAIETPAMPENPPETWLTYHLAHPGPGNATPGDPNPAFFWKGRYHLHYIYKIRVAANKGVGPDFAHVSSEDMVHWKWHPTVLGPKTMGHGMFSGTGFITKDGRPGIIYHGKGSGRNWIAYALDDNLDQWSKPELVLPHDKDGKPVTDMPYFDPDLWINNGIYYALNARSSSQSPVIMKSEDLKEWDYIGELLHPDFDEETLGVGRDEDISCPNMFKLGDKWVLLCISHRLGCRYFIGDFKDEQFLPEQHGMMNWAAWDFFAPESLLTPDGRRVMWAWCTPMVRAKVKPVPRKRDFPSLLTGKIQTGIQSLPRELSLSEDGMLRIKPLRELKKLRSDEKTVEDITVKSDTTRVLEGISGDTMELKIVLEAPSAREFGVKVLCGQDGSEGFTIASGKGSKSLKVGYIKPPFELKEGEDLTLRIFIDKHLIEVFANDRQAAVAWHDYDADDLHISLFSKGGDLRVKSVSAWQMKSIYTKAEGGLK
jgi:sucrose-6-phosphate hydrolase SacC (GH32 family)